MTSDLLFILWTPAPPVRITDLDSNPWFVAADVCRVLGYANPPQVVSRLDSDEKDILNVDTLGGAQNSIIISESGLYSLVLTSRKPEAKAFKRWITGTVLPSIRKHGGYIAGQGLARIQSAPQGGQRCGGHRPSRQPWEPLTTYPESTTAMRPAAGGIPYTLRREIPRAVHGQSGGLERNSVVIGDGISPQRGTICISDSAGWTLTSE